MNQVLMVKPCSRACVIVTLTVADGRSLHDIRVRTSLSSFRPRCAHIYQLPRKKQLRSVRDLYYFYEKSKALLNKILAPGKRSRDTNFTAFIGKQIFFQFVSLVNSTLNSIP